MNDKYYTNLLDRFDDEPKKNDRIRLEESTLPPIQGNDAHARSGYGKNYELG